MDTTFLKQSIREIADFPKKGILFRDITTVLKDPRALKQAADGMAELASQFSFDAVLGPESRGFIFGMPVAASLHKGFIPVRKDGKLPAKTARKEYSLEYGSATIEIHEDAIEKGGRYVLVDDLLATGGTARATAELVSEMGGIVAAQIFFIELGDLGGRAVLQGYDVRSLVVYG